MKEKNTGTPLSAIRWQTKIEVEDSTFIRHMSIEDPTNYEETTTRPNQERSANIRVFQNLIAFFPWNRKTL